MNMATSEKNATVTCSTATLSIPEAAKRLGATTWFVRTLIWRDELHFVRIGRRYCVTVADLDRWIDTHRELWSEQAG